MQLVPLSTIVVRKRQRKTIATTPLNELKESILKEGLLHPPVCWLDTSAPTPTHVLVVGERRFTAISKIAEEKRTFVHANTEVPVGQIPVTLLGDYLDEVGRFEAELAENVYRVDLEWQDRMQAFAELHKMRQLVNPHHTISDTGRELIDHGVFKGTPQTDRSQVHAGAAAKNVSTALILAEHMDNEKVANARNPAEALTLVYRMQEEKALAALAKRGMALAKGPQLIEVRNADLLTTLPALDASTFDFVCGDPPYGQSASSAGYRSRTAIHHNYKDDVDTAKEIYRCILTEGFRVTKPRANLILFCSITLFDWLKTLSANMGWVPFERPLIWQKSESEGLAPWGGSGPRITTEFIFYATKGQRGMNASPTDVFTIKRVPRNERIHAAEKPVELMSSLIQCCTLPGERILDPCCGSGSALVAAKALGRTGLGIEKDPDYYNTALANIFGKAQSDAKA